MYNEQKAIGLPRWLAFTGASAENSWCFSQARPEHHPVAPAGTGFGHWTMEMLEPFLANSCCSRSPHFQGKPCLCRIQPAYPFQWTMPSTSYACFSNFTERTDLQELGKTLKNPDLFRGVSWKRLRLKILGFIRTVGMLGASLVWFRLFSNSPDRAAMSGPGMVCTATATKLGHAQVPSSGLGGEAVDGRAEH